MRGANHYAHVNCCQTLAARRHIDGVFGCFRNHVQIEHTESNRGGGRGTRIQRTVPPTSSQPTSTALPCRRGARGERGDVAWIKARQGGGESGRVSRGGENKGARAARWETSLASDGEILLCTASHLNNECTMVARRSLISYARCRLGEVKGASPPQMGAKYLEENKGRTTEYFVFLGRGSVWNKERSAFG